MANLSDSLTPRRRGRVFPDRQLSTEEKQMRKAEDEALVSRCRPIFEALREELIARHYNWYININPGTGEYLLASDEMKLLKQLKEKPRQGKTVTFCINETGACGRI